LVSYLCAKEIQKTEKPVCVLMGDGSGAQWISPDAEPGAERKKPDYAGYPFCDEESWLASVDHKKIFNRIPGDAKLYGHIRREMLPPDGAKYNPNAKNLEAHKVISQIHGYMDSHEARYGYIVTDQELIFFRRRDTGWGHIDISKSIGHNVEPNAETCLLNSNYVLFYFHWKIANDESNTGWRLASFAKEVDRTDQEAPAVDPMATVRKRLRAYANGRIHRWKVSDKLVGALAWVASIVTSKGGSAERKGRREYLLDR
jgi:hypothetical protein